ncbi:MAG: hypothetical protein FWF60_08185 [Oscillospiraceae bacterium]|nr:hypothetical protein [Oscillospiraceae bacterium]
MLAKLLKNDFIQTGRMYLWVLGVGIVGGGVGALFTLRQEVGAGTLVIALLWNCLLMLGAAALELMAVVVILVGTNRSLFTERGYLTFALPVSTLEMLTSKFITNVTFMLLSIAEVVGLVVVAMLNIRRVISKTAETVLGQMNMGELKEMFSPEVLGLPTFSELMQFLGFVLVLVVVFLLLAMMMCLFVLTISHVRPFSAKPGLWIPIFLIIGAVVCQLVSARLPVLLESVNIHINVTLKLGSLAASESPTINMVTAIVMLGLTAGLFFLTNYLLSKKISLK